VSGPAVAVLLPCLDEEEALPLVLGGLPRGWRVVVCDNGSSDGSVAVAHAAGAEVAVAPRRGYGSALLAGLAHLAPAPPEVVVVVDADHSVYPEDVERVAAPVLDGRAEMVLGDRTLRAEPGALTLPQRVGNVVATRLIAVRTGVRYRDLGPLRAIRWELLTRLGMRDPTWGWNVEMQMKAARLGARIEEIPVGSRVRVGRSKISGSLRGATRAGAKMLWACWRYA